LAETQKRKARLSPAERRALLEDAACACIARGGIREFTVDKVVAEASVSHGLITHHYGSMDGLLVAVYSRMYRDWLTVMETPRPGLSRIEAMVDALVSPPLFDREVMNIWLTLWGEIANNPVLRAAHRELYGDYRTSIMKALSDAAKRNGRHIDAERGLNPTAAAPATGAKGPDNSRSL